MSSQSPNHVAIIGGGVMGSMFHALLPESTVITRDSFTQTDWDKFDTIIFAIKPQDFKVLSSLPFANKFIISVMAGIQINSLVAITGSQTVLRCMPNTTVRMKAGMTVWCKTPQVSIDQINWFTQSLSNETQLLEVVNDDWIDKATAISGCGPAYVLTTLQAFINAAQELGFTAEQSKLLVEQNLRGTLALLQSDQVDLPKLIQQLVTPQGVTERALAVFKKRQLDGIWEEAIQTAYKRAQELSQ